jgi:hypothetical protein
MKTIIEILIHNRKKVNCEYLYIENVVEIKNKKLPTSKQKVKKMTFCL